MRLRFWLAMWLVLAGPAGAVDFTLNNPGTVNNPWTPASVIIPVGAIQSDAQGWRPTTFATSTFAHNATYGATITTTATIATTSSGDDIVVGAVVRTGTNAGAEEGVWITGTNAICGTMNPGGTVTTVTSGALNTPRAISDVYSVTVAISSGTATITALQNGVALTFGGACTTATYATEASLAAGVAMLPNNNNGTRLSQFTGTGVAAPPAVGGAVSPSTMFRFGAFGLIPSVGSGSGPPVVFSPLQHFSSDALPLGQPPIVTGASPNGDQLFGTFASGFGAVTQNSVHRTTKSTAIALSIRAGSDGSGGGTGGADGGSGLFIAPPLSTGTSFYGLQGSWIYIGMYMFIPTGYNMTSNLQDGEVKFILQASPTFTTGKSDVHIGESGFALINEYDPNNNLNNSYPSTRAGTNTNWPINQWFWVERGTLLQSNGNLAQVFVWINNTLVLQQNGTTITWQTSDGNYHTELTGAPVGAPSLPNIAAAIEFIDFMGFWNGDSPQSQTLYIDDIVTANSQAGMMLDNRGNLHIPFGQF